MIIVYGYGQWGKRDFVAMSEVFVFLCKILSIFARLLDLWISLNFYNNFNFFNSSGLYSSNDLFDIFFCVTQKVRIFDEKNSQWQVSCDFILLWHNLFSWIFQLKITDFFYYHILPQIVNNTQSGSLGSLATNLQGWSGRRSFISFCLLFYDIVHHGCQCSYFSKLNSAANRFHNSTVWWRFHSRMGLELFLSILNDAGRSGSVCRLLANDCDFYESFVLGGRIDFPGGREVRSEFAKALSFRQKGWFVRKWFEKYRKKLQIHHRVAKWSENCYAVELFTGIRCQLVCVLSVVSNDESQRSRIFLHLLAIAGAFDAAFRVLLYGFALQKPRREAFVSALWHRMVFDDNLDAKRTFSKPPDDTEHQRFRWSVQICWPGNVSKGDLLIYFFLQLFRSWFWNVLDFGVFLLNDGPFQDEKLENILFYFK